jgi:O-antigen/teichoic acid export membrane protein
LHSAFAPRREGGSSVRRDFSWTLVGNVFYMACQWLMVIVTAKLGSPAMVGQFTLALAICSPVMLFAGMALRVVVANDVRGERTFASYLGLRVVTTTAAIAVTLAIVIAGDYSHTVTWVVVAITTAKAFESLSDIVWGELQRHEEMIVIARAMILKGGLSIVAFAGTLAACSSLPLATLAMALAWLVTLAAYDLRWGKRIAGTVRPTFARAELRPLALRALPLGVVVMLISLSTNVPRYFLSHHRGEYELGVFSAVANFMAIGMSVMGALGQVFAPRLARSYSGGDRAAFRRQARFLLGVATALGVTGFGIAALLGRPLLTLIYTHEYASAQSVLMPLMLAAFANYLLAVFGFMVNAAGLFRPQVPLQVLNVCAVAVACRIAVPTYGTIGAAWAIVVATAATLIPGVMLAIYTMHTVERRAS